MPKIMPVAIQDKTADFILQMSQGNQALARLYTQLLARYEEARLSEDFKREMFEKGNAAWKERYDYQQNPQDESERHHPFGSGAPPAANAPPATAAPNARPQARPMPMIPGAAPIPGGDSFDRSSSAPVAPTSAPAGSVPATPGYDSFAQATGADHTDFSAQSRIGQPPQQQQQRTPRGTSRRVAPPAGQLPRGTGMDPPPRRARQPPAQAEFLPIQPEWLQKMHDAETKWKVPHGSVLAVYGFENSGGRFVGRNKRSTAAGIGQFTEELMDEYKVPHAARNDPNVMIDLIARNMSRNARVLERDHKIKLDPSNPQHLPFYTFMHQFGVTDGPLAVRQYLVNPSAPMTQVMANVKKRDGTPRNNAETLANNLIPSNYTVGKVIEQHASIVQPWYDNGLKLMSGVKPSAPATTTTPPAVAPQSQATPATPPAGTAAAATPPTPPADVPNTSLQGQQRWPRVLSHVNIEKVVPAAVRAVNEVQSLYPKIQVISGYRGQGHRLYRPGSQHSKPGVGTAIDLDLTGLSNAEKTDVMERLRQRGAKGIGNYGGNSVHADWRGGGNVAWGPAPRGSGASSGPISGAAPWFQRVANNHVRGVAPVVSDQTKAPTAVAAPAQQPAPAQPPAQQVATRAPKPTEVFQSPNIKPTVDEPFKASDVTKSNRRAGLFDSSGASMFDVPVSPTLAGGPDIFTTSINEDPWRPTPVAKLASSTGGPPQVPQASGREARNDESFIAGGAPVVPQASGVAARSDLDYNAVPPPAQREAPAVGPYEAAPEAPPMPPVEAPLMEQPQPSPLQAPTPDIATGDAVPQASTPFDWPTEGMPQPPDITGPAISLQGQMPNAPTPQEFYPPPAFPQVAETSHNYDPNSRAGRRIDYARRQAAEAGPVEPSYMDQLIRGITDRGSINPPLPMPPPWGSSVADAPPQPQPQAPPRGVAVDQLPQNYTPPTMGKVLKAIYGSQIKAPYVPPAKPDAPPQPDVPPSAIPRSPFHEGPQAVVPSTGGMPQIPRNPHSIVADFQKMKEAVEQGRVPEGMPNLPYTRDPSVRNSIMDKIKELAQRYAADYEKNYYPDRKPTLQSNIQQDAKRAKPQSYGADWMPKQLGAATAPTQQDDLPPPVTAPPIIQKPGGSSQQPAVMPSMAPSTPPAPKPGSGGGAPATGGPQVMGGAARKAAASAAVGPGMGYSWVNDDNVVEFDNNPP